MPQTKTDRLTLALQKKGRLAEKSCSLLKKTGMHFTIRGDGLLARVKNMPLDLLLLRDDDIPAFVSNGTADLGIVGENILLEEEYSAHAPLNADIVMTLGFSRCQLCLAGRQTYTREHLTGLNIATTYPGILNHYLSTQNIKANIIEMKGAVELAPSIGIADIICDLVSSGATLEANGLVPFTTILKSEAVLIKTRRAFSPTRQTIYERLIRRIAGVTQSAETKYIMLNAPKDKVAEITDLLPGADAPTLMPLAGQEDLVALQAVCRETIFWETLEALKNLGARAILVLPIEKMME